MKKEAVLTNDGMYRYWLSREWDASLPRMCSFMLNPSDADAEIDDPTLVRNIGFARAWGYGALDVVNPFAFRSPYPQRLLDARAQGIDVVGPENARHIYFAFERSARIMVAWGAAPWAQAEAHRVLDRYPGRDFYAFKLTKNGAPSHPLYLPSALTPVLYRSKVGAA